MTDEILDPIGALWLSRTYDVVPLSRLPVRSQIGKRRITEINDDLRLETYPERMRPADDPVAHLQFHLRHEVTHLEFLARLFQCTGPAFVQKWINAEPTGQYARRAAFLYEWLTGAELQLTDRIGGNYVNVLDDEKLLTASSEQIVKVPRWRVNDNLPGTREFCPMVVKTEAVSRAIKVDVPRLFGELTNEFGEDLLLRAAVWLTLRESKASFAIEGEAERPGRVERFAEVMARYTGVGEVPLGDAQLARLQKEILGDRTSITAFGIRQSPVFVGEAIGFQEVVHYVAPAADEVKAMLEGLATFLEKTQNQSPVFRSAVAAFGFVYIHPLADGNGRVHRFLVNDILRRDGAIPDPVILPISAVITHDAGERRRYNEVLDEVSRPLMQAVGEHVTFEATRTAYPDGVVSNFAFGAHDYVRPFWRYPDLRSHVIYMADIIERTLTSQMREESRYLRTHARARAALKEIVEMPDQQADRVLRSLEQNRGQLSNILAKELPILASDGLWAEIVDAVSHIYEQDGIDFTITDHHTPGGS